MLQGVTETALLGDWCWHISSKFINSCMSKSYREPYVVERLKSESDMLLSNQAGAMYLLV
jgi:hypothetical protein